MTTVEDEYGNRYELTGELGEGGQGKVYIDSTNRFVVKILNQPDSLDGREKLTRQLRRVQTFELQNLPVARLLSMLRPPNLGYIMKYLKDMEPIESILRCPPETGVPDWYIQTGGLKRRIVLLSKLATILHKLHNKGLVYGDISPNNILISSSTNYSELYLIDLDNICYESSVGDRRVFTPFYEAPEVMKREQGVDTLTDAFSFAVLAFEVLTLIHPFIGDMVSDGTPDLELKAREGALPWILHSTDDRNKSSKAILPNYVLSKNMLDLFNKTFEVSLQDRKERPGLMQWEKKLHLASQHVITCQHCRWDYFETQENCPKCKKPKPAYMLLKILLYTYKSKGDLLEKKQVSGYCLQPGDILDFSKRLMGCHDNDADEVLISLKIDGNNIVVEPKKSGLYWVDDNKGRKSRIEKSGAKFPAYFTLHIGDVDASHYAIQFVMKGSYGDRPN